MTDEIIVLPTQKKELTTSEKIHLVDSFMFDVLAEGQITLNRINLGHVYILGSSTGYYKIGQTTNLVRRLKTFEVKMPFEIWLELSMTFVDCVWAEKFFHACFADKRVNGEWFKLEHKDLLYFQNYSDEWMDFKLSMLLGHQSVCPWDREFMQSLATYYPLPEDRQEIASKFGHEMHDKLRDQTKFRNEFFFRGMADWMAENPFPNNSESDK